MKHLPCVCDCVTVLGCDRFLMHSNQESCCSNHARSCCRLLALRAYRRKVTSLL